MSNFGRTLLGGSPFFFWALTPFLIAGAAAITLPPDYKDAFHLGAVIACDVAAVLLVLSLWPFGRIPGVKRLLTGWIGALFLYYVVMAWFPGRLPDKGTSADRWKALAGFVIIGLPCLKYAWLGRFSFEPDPIEIPPDEPLMLEAYAKARVALARLLDERPDGCDELAVHFPFVTSEEVTEHLWGEVRDLSGSALNVDVLTQPVTHSAILERLSIPITDVEDFEFEDERGHLHGGYTTRAMVAYADRESLAVPREVRKRLELYSDAA